MQNENRPPNLSIIKNNFWLLRQIWKYAPEYVIWMIIEGILWGFHHSLGIIYVQNLFDALGEHATLFKIVWIISSYAVYMHLFYIFHCWYWQTHNPKVREKLHIAMHSSMFQQAIRIDLEKYDDPQFYNDFVWSMEQSISHAVGLMEDTGKLINRIVASLTLIGVLVSVDGTMAIIILCSCFIKMGLVFFSNNLKLIYRDELNLMDRKENYIKRVFMLPDYAKELRVTRVAENLFEEHEINTRNKENLTREYGKKSAMIQSLNDCSGQITLYALMILMLYKIMVTGSIGLGGFAVAVNASWKMSFLLQDFVNRLLKYHEHGIFIEKMICFMNCEPKIVSGKECAPPFESLIIKGLKYSYNNGEQQIYALDGIDLEIYRGEKIAIVGYNGAGKTTLTKLLMRLNSVQSGEILYNGKNIADYNIGSLRDRIAAVFQDYRIFACSLAENVVGGEYIDELEKGVKDALIKSSCFDKVNSLNNGINTQLTREFDSTGTDLSGGEQQKVAIARAFFKDADLIILDEPSSALDPDAEYDLNRSIVDYAEGKTVIFISHRLSTTRHADRIYMFIEGKVVESGTHEELIAAGGEYAYMFNLQAEKYRKSNDKGHV